MPGALPARHGWQRGGAPRAGAGAPAPLVYGAVCLWQRARCSSAGCVKGWSCSRLDAVAPRLQGSGFALVSRHEQPVSRHTGRTLGLGEWGEETFGSSDTPF